MKTNFHSNLVYGQIIQQYAKKCYWMPGSCEPYEVNLLFKDNPSCVPENFRKIRETNLDATFLPFLDSPDANSSLSLLNLSKEIQHQTCLYASKLGLSGVIFPEQSLLIEGFRTRCEYSVGSKHFAVPGHVEDDIDPHMNSYYGETMLKLFSIISGLDFSAATLVSLYLLMRFCIRIQAYFILCIEKLS